MTNEQVKQGLNEVFRDVFDDESITVREETTAKDVSAWDSISQIDMLCAVEEKFGIKVTTKDMASLQNVGQLIALIERKQVSPQSTATDAT